MTRYSVLMEVYQVMLYHSKAFKLMDEIEHPATAAAHRCFGIRLVFGT